jgi:cytochrome c1
MIGGGIAHGFDGAWLQRCGVVIALAATACQPPPDNRRSTDAKAAQRGLAAIERVQCGACHEIPGARWPKGQSGPSLHGFAQRSAIAGTLPNRPDVLAAFVRNAPAVKPGSPMPPMPVTAEEARDIAVALYEVGQ